ncbi:MAG: VWA domain-containing protein [Acidobacteria bacterium]|nr:VWA domain-containing protein [Acidobacteriota bacterium]
MKQVFEFLLKFKPVVFEQGRLEFQNTNFFFFAIALAAVTFLALLHFHIAGRKLPSSRVPDRRRLLFALRLGALFLILLMLAAPSIVVSEINPRENRLAILVDHSRSMQIQDDPNKSRVAQVRRLLQPQGAFVRRAGEKFQTSFYRFADQAATQDLPEILGSPTDGKSTNLESALERVIQEMAHLTLAGIVIISDGADNASRHLNALVQKLRAQKIPIHTVGVGKERLDNDIELLHASIPRRLVPESVSTALLSLHNRGFGGRKVRVEVRDGEALIQSREITLQFENGVQTVELPFSVSSTGVKNLKFSVEAPPQDLLPQNNWTRTVLEVRDFQPKILYVEGEPRWEYKFLRRALADDRFLLMETLLRTANKKFYRQGIESEDTLAAGFPSQVEELFQYQGLILGTVESSFFTYHQLEMIRDFVGKRGGGFLMAGGKRSFGEGKYQNTPIEEILPIRLLAIGTGDYRESPVRPELTLHARSQSILNLAITETDNARRWKLIPPLEDFHALAEIKPAAMALANAGNSADASVLVATQRYGRGQALIFASGSSWLWRMSMDARDTSHQTFWRQLLRWMVHDVPGPISISYDKAQYVTGESAVVRAEVFNRSYEKASQTSPLLKVTDPQGQTHTYPMEWSAREGGVYSSQAPVDAEGVYRAEVETTIDGQVIREQSHFQTAESNLEFQDAGQHTELLKSLSDQTGGRYYPIEKAGDLPDEIIYQSGKSSHLQVKDLWDAPIFYFLILTLLAAEWSLRRRWGYA